MMDTPDPLPSRPRLVLRIGFAGNRSLPADPAPLDAALDRILAMIAGRLVDELRSGTTGNASARITRFYSPAPPLLRLVTGLAEGADERAALALDRLRARQTADADAAGVQLELAGILPFRTADYRRSRDAAFQPIFDRRRAQCAYVFELDGIYAPHSPDAPAIDARRRARAYRAQSILLLRHADLVIVAVDLSATGKPGGTLDTIRAAQANELPIVLIDLADDAVRLIEPADDVRNALDEPPSPAALEKGLGGWVQRIVADPDAFTANALPSPAKPSPAGESSVEEFFSAQDSPPRDASGKRRSGFRERVWTFFESCFRRMPGPGRDPAIAPFASYRDRATALNYHYVGLYRGAFVLNYALAVFAVFLAVLSLVLIGRHSAHAIESHPAGEFLDETAFILGGLALLKLAALIWIYRNTHGDEYGDWSDRAVDFRYLAERLRSMYYLPLLGSFRPPSATPPKYASRNVRQSGIDWLFQAVVRSVSPATLGRPESVMPSNPEPVPTLRVDVENAHRRIRDSWIGSAYDSRTQDAPGGGQILYHQRNHDTLSRMHRVLDGWVRRLNLLVIAVVGVDLAAVLFRWDEAHGWTVWLVFIAAVLPAAVASLNGLRFQSECQRLADRSGVMCNLLKDRASQAASLQAAFQAARANPTQDLGAYEHEVLMQTEEMAQELLEEVAEWSVLYAKNVTDT